MLCTLMEQMSENEHRNIFFLTKTKSKNYFLIIMYTYQLTLSIPGALDSATNVWVPNSQGRQSLYRIFAAFAERF